MNVVYFIAALIVLAFAGINAWVNHAYLGAVILLGVDALLMVLAALVANYDPMGDLPSGWGGNPK